MRVDLGSNALVKGGKMVVNESTKLEGLSP
jgi:hypothetical protein